MPIPHTCQMCSSTETFQNSFGDIWLCPSHYNSLRNVNDSRAMSNTAIGDNERGIIKSSRTFGVELECFADHKYQYLYGIYITPSEWGLKHDGTIGGNFTREIITCPLYGKKGEELLQYGCGVLTDTGFKTNVSCGSHCHIGIPEAIEKMSEKKERIVEKNLKLLALLYTVFDPVMLCLLPKSRRTNAYCAPLGNKVVKIDKDTRTVFGKFKEEERFDMAFHEYDNLTTCRQDKNRRRGHCGTRYGINFGSIYYRGTIEIRYHEGTLDAERLIHWMALHSAMVDTAMNGELTEQQILKYTDITDVKKLFTALLELLSSKLDPITITYTQKRFKGYKKYNPKHGYIGTIYSEQSNMLSVSPSISPSASLASSTRLSI